MARRDCGDLIAQCRIGTCDGEGEPVKGGPTSHVDVYRTDNAVRIVVDPFGEDHDVLIEQHEEEWLVFVHPQGQDPVCVVSLNMKRAIVTNDLGFEITRADF